jgi:hypothetical protein
MKDFFENPTLNQNTEADFVLKVELINNSYLLPYLSCIGSVKDVFGIFYSNVTPWFFYSKYHMAVVYGFNPDTGKFYGETGRKYSNTVVEDLISSYGI